MDCPGCGIQRSISFLLEGDLIASFIMYPGLFPVAGLFAFLAADLIIKIKYAEKIKLWLTFFSLGTIMISYLIKLLW